MLSHPIPPLYNGDSEILILGSFPSVKSRETMFFYGHPQNRFWKVMAKVYESDEPKTIEEKRAFVLKNHVALWDVIASCDIEGSADSSIKNVQPNDLTPILNTANIRQIFANGKTAERYYNRYILPTLGRAAICLPSTSPANATWSVERLADAWKIIKNTQLNGGTI